VNNKKTRVMYNKQRVIKTKFIHKIIMHSHVTNKILSIVRAVTASEAISNEFNASVEFITKLLRLNVYLNITRLFFNKTRFNSRSKYENKSRSARYNVMSGNVLDVVNMKYNFYERCVSYVNELAYNGNRKFKSKLKQSEVIIDDAMDSSLVHDVNVKYSRQINNMRKRVVYKSRSVLFRRNISK
jgi:hypothetical protein